MGPPARDPPPSPALTLRAVLGDRATRAEGGPPLADGLVPHLRVIIARVLRTGRGPQGLVEWVRHQADEHRPPPGDLAEHLAVKLSARLIPPSDTTLPTVEG
jgi:hypothetical protein